MQHRISKQLFYQFLPWAPEIRLNIIMKIIAQIARLFVGALFIFSGLIKINDPIGFSIKLKEYFDVFSSDIGSIFGIFKPISLELAVIICVLEVVLGVAMLINYRIKLTIWITLGMIIFFTFLTFYSAYFNKVTDCGCFGDAIPLTPWESFYKDVILTVLILIMFLFRNHYQPLLKSKMTGNILIGAVAAVLLFLSINVINHLPFIDFRPYKIGNNIQEQMQPSARPILEYTMVKDGKEYKFDKYPTDKSYKYKSVKTLNEEETIPKITDYSLWNDEGDFTDASLEGKKLFLVYQNLDKLNNDHADEINALVKGVEGKIDPIVLTSASGEAFEKYRHEVQLGVPYYFSDGTVLKAIIRSNPGILLLQDGTVLGKWHCNDTPSAKEVLSLLK